jgi:cytochrome b6-f complex iron-sulfur subunit
MAETHQIVTKVWIAPGCIVCDACENDCPEVFDVQEETCLIRPAALKAEFLGPLTPSIQVAAEGCPVDVIKFDLKEVPGPAPWAGQEQPVAAAAGAGEHRASAPAAKKETPLGPPDPKWQALIGSSKISPSLSAGLGTTVRKSTEVLQAEEIVRAVALPKNAPPDQRAAVLAAGGAYLPAQSLADRIRGAAANAGKTTRREFNVALTVAWAAMAFCGATFAAMFQDFFSPKVLKEPKKQWRVGRMEDYSIPDRVYEDFKRTPDGGSGFWIVNLKDEQKLVALSIICTHLGCIPAWLQADQKFKCPCHGSGYYINGVNFEGPTPRPLERFALSIDADGYLNVDMTKIYRQELGEWVDPECFIGLA